MVEGACIGGLEGIGTAGEMHLGAINSLFPRSIFSLDRKEGWSARSAILLDRGQSGEACSADWRWPPAGVTVSLLGRRVRVAYQAGGVGGGVKRGLRASSSSRRATS